MHPTLAALDLMLVGASTTVFTGVIVFLVVLLSVISKKLSPGGEITIDINDGKKTLTLAPGGKLLLALAENDIFVPSACGGGGTCAMCKCVISEGGGDILPTETGLLKRQDQKAGVRLACQVPVKESMKISVPDEVLEIQKFEGTVRSNDNVATFIKEFIVDLPPGVNLDFQAGGYIQIDIPEYEMSFNEIDIDDEYKPDWDKMGLWDNKVKNEEACFRAYSMGNHPAEGNMVMLNVRIANPPRGVDAQWGIASSYIFNRKPGDKVTISGPYGEFFQKDTQREMVYIGGGAGMAPLRSHLFHLFHTEKSTRKVSYWYGGRSLRELFYTDHFRDIEEKFPNFSYHIALSEPQPEDNWEGPTGFIHQAVLDNFLAEHPEPEEVEYYLCGPPLMLNAVRKMLDDLGVDPEMIAFDEF